VSLGTVFREGHGMRVVVGEVCGTAPGFKIEHATFPNWEGVDPIPRDRHNLFSIVRDMRIRGALVTATHVQEKSPAMYAAGLSFREIEPCYFGPNARLHKRKCGTSASQLSQTPNSAIIPSRKKRPPRSIWPKSSTHMWVSNATEAGPCP
jgi:hypothetical protein